MARTLPAVPSLSRAGSERGRGQTARAVAGAGAGAGADEAADYETALHAVGYGRASARLLAACALAFLASGAQSCVMAYALPAASCQLRLGARRAGLLHTAYMSGGAASAFFWGAVGDACGRRNVLAVTLLLDGAVTLAQSAAPHYGALLAARTLNGFLIGAPATLVFPYASDLVGRRRRQRYLGVIGMSFIAAWLLMPALSWLVAAGAGGWRLLVALTALPALAGGLGVLSLPESPRLLLRRGRKERALALLRGLHADNRTPQPFKITKLLEDEAAFAGKDTGAGALASLRRLLWGSYALEGALILLVFFANMSAGFGLGMWIPELLLRAQGAPGTGACRDGFDPEVLRSGLVVGACCVLGNAACLALCARGGARGVRSAAAGCALACAGAAAYLAVGACERPASASVGAVAAAALLNAASLNGNVLLIRLLMRALPPELAGPGVCWGAWWGRLGGVASNAAVGALLDHSCPAPFAAAAALLALSAGGIMAIRLEEGAGGTGGAGEAEAEEAATAPAGLVGYVTTHM